MKKSGSAVKLLFSRQVAKCLPRKFLVRREVVGEALLRGDPKRQATRKGQFWSRQDAGRSASEPVVASKTSLVRVAAGTGGRLRTMVAG
ncbi:MAG: hypothetical protein AB1523_10715 [Bacillota bacterium]